MKFEIESVPKNLRLKSKIYKSNYTLEIIIKCIEMFFSIFGQTLTFVDIFKEFSNK